MRSYKIIGTARNGKLDGADRAGLTDFLMQNEGYELQIKVSRTGRISDPMRGWIWMTNQIIANRLTELWGEPVTKERVHEISKLKLNPVEKVIEATGEVITWGGSTMDLNTPEGCDYMERYAHYWSNAIGVEIKMPGEQITLELIETK